MTQSISYRFGKFIGSLPTWGKVSIVVVGLAWMFWPTEQPTINAEHTANASTVAGTKQARDAALAAEVHKECEATVSTRIADYSALIEKRKYWDAALILRQCASTLGRPDLEQLVRTAEINSHIADLTEPKKSLGEKEIAFDRLTKDYPKEAEKHQQLAKRQIDASRRKEQEEDRKQRRSQGVRIGMTKEDVLASAWGKPKSINTTTNVLGTREQWVYGGRNYLYFENGALTSIQN